MNIANINFLVKSNKTQEIFPDFTWVLSILLTTATTNANVERVNSKVYQRFHVRFLLPAMHRGEFSAAITQLVSTCLWSGWKWQKRYKEIVSPFTYCPVNREYSWKKARQKKKTKTRKASYVLQHVRTNSRCMLMKSVLNLSWWTSLLYRNHSIDLQNKSVDWFLYYKNLRHERVNALLLACIHWDIFLIMTK